VHGRGGASAGTASHAGTSCGERAWNRCGVLERELEDGGLRLGAREGVVAYRGLKAAREVGLGARGRDVVAKRRAEPRETQARAIPGSDASKPLVAEEAMPSDSTTVT
jgi:hypothetical protein